MAETQIEWTDATWNPVAGCSMVTAGCTHCYAMAMAKRLEAMGVEKYAGLTHRRGKRAVWNGVVKEDRHALVLPLAWKKPRKIFVNSMSDLFHERVSDTLIMDVWQVMRDTPRHNYQVLTKRPERMAEIVSNKIKTVLPNVWLGTSVENEEAVGRLDHLRQTPAAIRFISFEPLIGPVVIERHIKRRAVGTLTLPGLLKIKVVGKPATKARKIISPFTPARRSRWPRNPPRGR